MASATRLACAEALEEATVFRIEGEELPGILHRPLQSAERGLLLVVGGPQYRIGSHRQFLLLARYLAEHGVPVFRFDYRGMGDAGGEQRGYDAVETDIGCAIDEFQRLTPAVREVVVWGLCDAASAALLYASQDRRISGLVLLNPWVRTEAGIASAYLRHYYWRQLFSGDFWMRLLTGRLSLTRSARGLMEKVAVVLRANARRGHWPEGQSAGLAPGDPLPVRMAAGWRRFDGPILLVLSGDDLTAAEFVDTATRNDSWLGLLDQERVTTRRLEGADHTFSRAVWRNQVAEWTLQWLEASRRDGC
ncbi:hydrolase 1, exosortase A system-associated [Halorhodospira halophila]|uniref:Esterase/lipase/thioesterase family n=1 Tax=Halorhodospira halophila (strain DSM 244 / SL1) TaxID=349124 RepID=A1WXC2_HALHL|nr:hydrolase 1, exosortase A system-associated [Halorhodospira halophila]ABM62334.1 esterase/lipase/thioesterase family [Halorhodospira halophila SL1]MBK1730065.1 hydrolase 1, exosortase A system-associated [Halorhodospira halophila]